MKKIAIILALISISYSVIFAQSKDEISKAIRNGDISQAGKMIETSSDIDKDDHVFLLSCGDVFVELEMLDKAVKYYRLARKADRKDMEVLLKLGRTLYITGEKEDGLEYINDAIDRYDDSVDPYLELASIYLKDNKINEAEKNIMKAKEIDDTDARVYLALGDMYFKNGVYQLSIREYKQALVIDQENLDARKKLAISYFWSANREDNSDLSNELFTQSLKEWNTITFKDPKNANAWFEKGRILYLSKQWANAANSLYHYVNLRPDGALGRWYYAQSLYEVGKCDSAAPHLEWVSLNIDSVSQKSKFMLAKCYYKNKDYANAISSFESLRKDNTLDLRDIRRLATSYLKTGDTVKWISTYDEAIEREPESNCKAILMIGKLHLQKKNYDDAARYFKKKLQYGKCNEKDEAKTNYFVGYAYLFGNQADSAQVYLQKAIDLNPEDLTSRVYMADLIAKKGSLDSATTMLKNIVETAIKDTVKYKKQMKQAFTKFCGLLYKVKKTDLLIKYGKMWAEFRPKDEYAYLYTALAYQTKASTNDALKPKACQWYRKTLKINPKNKTANKQLSALGC